MKYFIKNAKNGLIRFCRIQINSKMRNKNLYPDHHYKITCKMSEIYTPNSEINYEYTADLYLGNNIYFFTNTNYAFYYKLTETTDSTYLDIAIKTTNNYSNINIDIDTINEGSVVFYRDLQTEGEYTRVRILNSKVGILNAPIYNYIGANSNSSFNMKKGIIRVSNMATGDIAYIRETSIYNGSNTSFNLTITESDDYSVYINIASLVNGNYLIESVI